MITEYNYYPEDSHGLEQTLKLKYKINYINITLDFEVNPTKYIGIQEDDLIKWHSQEINYITSLDAPEVPIELTRHMKYVIGDFLDYTLLNSVALVAWEKEHE